MIFPQDGDPHPLTTSFDQTDLETLRSELLQSGLDLWQAGRTRQQLFDGSRLWRVCRRRAECGKPHRIGKAARWSACAMNLGSLPCSCS